MTDLRTNFMTRAVEWLRAGYPAGIPRQDYVALLGVLRRRMTEDEVRQIAVDLADQSVLAGDDPISTEDIEQMISASLLQEATPEDVVRVSARLATGGWPLVDPPTAE
ncbi:DUF3349 domain-containing protein [Amorphoplanes digitatis]|uniref:DUF3349 domain-containing protein n=1 Tax=Actinoplanes digitatis TaxID=1868 RepID=A0A7W7HWP2_9ACTN|nr:DUF3349 domain-containing protein [Actinoplanes digitatis]MBB4762175.1 hypothetical protein [Actinoplanes digitatis]GID96269.1 hypothetical protein Adi01nite_56810 [Actinoplanes digitatis]